MPPKFETRLILRDIISSSGIKLHVLSREKKFHHFDIHQTNVQFTEKKNLCMHYYQQPVTVDLSVLRRTTLISQTLILSEFSLHFLSVRFLRLGWYTRQTFIHFRLSILFTHTSKEIGRFQTTCDSKQLDNFHQSIQRGFHHFKLVACDKNLTWRVHLLVNARQRLRLWYQWIGIQ